MWLCIWMGTASNVFSFFVTVVSLVLAFASFEKAKYEVGKVEYDPLEHDAFLSSSKMESQYKKHELRTKMNARSVSSSYLVVLLSILLFFCFKQYTSIS